MSFIKRITASQMVRGSLFVFIASNISNFGNFLYNLAMGRLLEPKHYGDLGALFSLLVLFGIPTAILQLAVVKQISAYFGRKEYDKINYLISSSLPKVLLVGFLAAFVLIILKELLTSFLHLENSYPVILLSIMMIFTFSSAFNRSVLQGLLRFKLIAFNSFIETISRLFISVILVLLNFKLFGAISGSVVSLIVFFLISNLELHFILGKRKGQEKIKNIFPLNNIFPSLFTTLSMTIFFTADVILVRHFFNDPVAGDYVALSTLGRILFYAVGPILTVMFPLISSKSSKGDPYLLQLLSTLIFVFAVASVLIFAYFLFPEIIVTLFYGSKYAGIAPYMGIFSFFMLLYTINSVLTHFLLSVSCSRSIYCLFVISLFQSILISIFHARISDIIWINISVSFVYLSFASYFVLKKEKKILGLLLKNFSR